MLRWVPIATIVVIEFNLIALPIGRLYAGSGDNAGFIGIAILLSLPLTSFAFVDLSDPARPSFRLPNPNGKTPLAYLCSLALFSLGVLPWLAAFISRGVAQEVARHGFR